MVPARPLPTDRSLGYTFKHSAYLERRLMQVSLYLASRSTSATRVTTVLLLRLICLWEALGTKQVHSTSPNMQSPYSATAAWELPPPRSSTVGIRIRSRW